MTNRSSGYDSLGKLGGAGFTIALSGVGLAVSEAILLHRVPSALDALIVGLLVLGGYRLDYAFDSKRPRKFAGVIAMLLLLCASSFTWIHRGALPALGLWFFPLIVLLYMHELGPKSWRWRRFKDIPYFKNFYTGLGWGSLVIFTALLAKDSINAVVIWFAVAAGLRMFINAAACDFKDQTSDRDRGVKTIAATLGRRKTCRLLHGVNFLIVVITTLLVVFGVLATDVLWFHFAALYPAAYLLVLEKRWFDDRWLAAVVVDLEFLFWPLCLYSLWPLALP